jgi:trehalose 6-phosphate phosphatase
VKNILAKAQLNVVKEFTPANTLLAFDFDGTLASINQDPRAAQLRASTRRALAAVAARYPTVVISGRARADVLARLETVPLRAVIGNHGLEPSPDAQKYRDAVKTWLPRLRAALDGREGVEIENKLYSLSIHYRHAKQRGAALDAILEAVAALNGEARVIAGKLVVNLLPTGAPDKGSALCALRRTLQTERMIYVGDDSTDEDAFKLRDSEQLLGIRIGRSANTQAAYYLTKQTDIDRFLENLLELPNVA